MDVLRERDFWFRYHGVDENAELEAEYEFRLPCSERFELRLDADPHRLALTLVERTSQQRHELGWWDQGRWHPFALRWVELSTLVRGWEQRSDVLAAPFPLLLLSPFIGFGVDDKQAHEEASQLVADAYRSLGFERSDVSRLTTASLPPSSETDYRWTRDDELGWVFGGEYPCYTLRNRAHRGGEEGRFPFALVRELFADLRD